ncbi:EAL and HDOD domain-containing protein [Solimicrobium silvestre]|uniref:Putative signal transduction protein containing EAL and modified HD-GYP domain n=1 Tax=Solimicrobium silvestre TaxID=2099400 RepID=A0A2S9GZD2_9BURK|nr:HDOD domain-containing protein [Solimicrobium silvestre]PRC92976.1 putative signal transduction protein containing EAL and modified HD-GYP domain [Solimicrobium silvestre]
MEDVNFILREPLLNSKQQVIGYELSWQQKNTEPLNVEELNSLLVFVVEQFHDNDTGWLLADSLLFLETVPALFHLPALKLLPPANTVLTIRRSYLADEATLEAVKELRAQGYGICLRGADINRLDKTVLGLISHIEVRLSATDFAAQAKMYAALKQSSIRMVARQLVTWQDFDACAALGLDAFVGKLHLTPRPEQDSQPKGINAAQTVILQLMELVRKNADIASLEAVLRRDAGLSYKLLQYINSAGFGLRTPIQSLKHAVQLLGYSPLYRWLSVLLATASSSGYSPVLMETAIVRGRFAELLGIANLPKGDAENLFVAGMFSLLDRLLNVPMERVLATVQLPEMVSQALLTREGLYGPYLSLAEACELNSALAGSLAESLHIATADVNQAHLSALVWAKNVAAAAKG